MLDRLRVREIFSAAAELPRDQIAAFLERECGPDTALREEVDSLLAAAWKRPAFLGAPTAAGMGVIPDSPGEVGTTIGHYHLVKELGQGGFGSVYLAEQSQPVQRRVAIKIIKLGMDTRAVIARFEAERQALAMMDHANIARVFDAGTTDSGRPYFVMELVEGEPITTYCDTKNLSIEDRLEIFGQVCRAVQHAHSKGVIHRDIKPGNVLVSTADGRAHAKVIDFGIAKAIQHDLMGKTAFTECRQFVGTPEYMSPEQAGGAPDVDARSDVYSLGVLLYELLIGATPFDPKELRSAAYADIQRIIRDVEPPKPSTRLSTLGALASVAALRRTLPDRLSALVTGDLDWIVMKALEKDRARRYETPTALASDVERHLGGEPVSAAPPSISYRTRKFVRRNRTAVLAVATIAALLVLGTTGTTMGWVKALHERRRAEDQRAIADHEADQTRAVNEFMRTVLTSVEPQNQGADVRLMDVLAESSESASARFAGHPLLEARVREILGTAYNRLSLWERSRSEFRRANSLYEVHAGPDDAQTLESELHALESELNLGLVRHVETALAPLLSRLERLVGVDAVLTLHARRLVADVHTMRGRPDDAEPMLLALRAHPALSADDRMQIRILHSMFRMYHMRPQIDDHAHRVAFWGGIVPLGHECVERAVRLGGPNSLLALQSQNHLAFILDAHEEFAAAAEVSRAVLAGSSERLGECHHIRTSAMSSLAGALARLGQADEAADMQLRCIACRRETSPGDTITLLSSLTDAMYFLDRAGRAAEGEAVAREVVTELSKTGGHVSTFIAEVFVAGFASMAGRFDEADALLQTLRSRAESSQDPHAQACAELSCARHLTRLGRFEESEMCLRRCVDLRGDVTTGTYEGLPDDIVFAYIELYKAWGKPEQVLEFERLRETAFGIPPRAVP